ncbi:Ribosomal protein L11 methyltransferase [hydrothermal vent metagenome]|uniref:Ribosomal protein L11 methyltransferase n=1 Tax=hydrothermal vent metagenome TaxID=652676 RepID=A0A3B0RUT3_9ZZZZ
MQQFILTTPGLAKDDALFLSSMLDEAYFPAAHAVSCSCVDEPNDLWVVEAYYDEQPNRQDFETLLADLPVSLTDLTIKPVENRNWVEESLKGLAPVHAGRFYVHGSHDRHTRQPARINLQIDAGTAFGTGHHGTTTGCLLALNQLAKANQISNILDVGCGTGVLAIAAARLLKKPTIASDIDPEAVRVTKRNAASNQVAPLLSALTASGIDHRAISQSAPYDLIFANILAGPLVVLAPQITPFLSAKGHVVLSGLTTDQERWVLAAWQAQGLVVKNRFRLNNWSTLVLGFPLVTKKVRHDLPVKDRTGQILIAKWLGRRFAGV